MKRSYWLVLFIFAIAAFLRFWKVPQLFFFGIDEEYQTLLAWEQVKHFHKIWIGLSAANTGYYIGPGLVYLHALLLKLSGGDPLIFGYFASLVGFATLIILYFVVRKLFDQRTALIATILSGFSPFVVYYDRRFWNSTFVPITAILLFYSLVRAKKNPRWYILTAFLIAASFHIHASLFIFIPITLISIAVYLIKTKPKKIDWLTIGISTMIYFVITSPLLVYDLVHNFDNLKTPFRILSQIGKGSGHFSILQHLTIFPAWMTIAGGIILIWFFLSEEGKKHAVLKTVIGFYLFLFLFYPGPMLDYYYLGFFPFFAIMTGMLLKKLNNKILSIMAISYITVSCFIVLHWPENGGLAAKKIFIQKTSRQIGNNSFYLATNQNYLYFGGWRYLFKIYGKTPAQSQADQLFGWIYPEEIAKVKPKLTVTVSENNGHYQSVITKND